MEAADRVPDLLSDSVHEKSKRSANAMEATHGNGQDATSDSSFRRQSSSGMRRRKNQAQSQMPLRASDSMIPTSNAGEVLENCQRPTMVPNFDIRDKDADIDESYVNSLVGSMRPSVDASTHHKAITTIDSHFRYFSICVLSTWIVLVMVCYFVVPSENIVRLSGTEQRSAATAMSLIAISFLSRIIPLIGGGQAKRNQTIFSGIYLGALTVQIVAFMTDFLMTYFPTPVVIDPVLGTRVHLLRWCEWCPCAAFMTFMMEGADLYWTGETPPPDFLMTKYQHALSQGGAVFLGLVFPFCPGFWSWLLCMVTSCTLYLTNYPRLLIRRKEIPKKLKEGATVEEEERFNSASIALRLRYTCLAVWSIIVIQFFLSSIYGPKMAPEGSFLHSPAANMISECLFDVLSKVLFLVVIVDVHYAIFDPFARTERRLEELRKLMSAVWESSSDVIAISVRTEPNGGSSTMLSPAFFGLGSSDGPFRRLSMDQIKDMFHRKSVLFQFSKKAFLPDSLRRESNDLSEEQGPNISPDMIFNIEYTGFSADETPVKRFHFDGQEMKPDLESLRAVADVVIKAWKCEEREVVLSHDLQWIRVRDGKKFSIFTEAKVSRLDENALIVVIRDISERVKMFEAEKQVLLETTSRQKDAEANRFTRHEVKNGLLAAIGLYESLCEAQRTQLSMTEQNSRDIGLGFEQGDSDLSENVVRCMNELGKSLHETLETILVEAMSRDLVHDLYRPYRERIDIGSVLSGISDGNSFDVGVSGQTRFPLITRPSPLPLFHLDPQLLRYLHRQALSNACKYGKTGGMVLTEILYDDKTNKLQINVINLPGEFHHKLLAMGPQASDAVFAKGIQLHEQFFDVDDSVTKRSGVAALPGDGGWIMQKCAKILKGTCSITFEDSRTVFTVALPAKPFGMEKIKVSMDVKNFTLPLGIWGIAIDDSKIQQKLLVKFFEFAGIPKNRIKVFGSSDEIMSFVDYVVNFMDEHMGEQVLMIADENLEVTDGASRHITVSGSQLVENIRSRLLPEQERVLIALIRSANDSSSDVAIYKARAHGFLPKAPIKKANVLETLAPLWLQRYPPKTELEDDQSRLTRSDSFSSLESSTSSLNEAIASTPIEIIQTVNEIDKLFTKGSVLEDWDNIWDKLHALKGDLLTLQVGSKVISCVGMINSFREMHTDEQLIEQWNLLRERINSLTAG